ncbi:MAG: pilus assembly protein [Alphaproteobacteria bacterium]|nr:pilus assembly protein [Alphaproteobacteria bacterium]
MSFKAMFRGIKITKLSGFFQRWLRARDGIAAIEAAMVFPLLMTLLLGTFDMGNAILSNQKTIRASQIAADLVTRTRSVDSAMIDEAIEASRLAFSPFSTNSYGVDMVSISFDDDSNPQIVWRETRNMTAVADVLDRVSALAEPGGGVMVVVVEFSFEPIFAGFVVDEIQMQEVAFARGRKSAVVSRI